MERREALKAILAGLAATPLFREASAAALLERADALRAAPAGSFLNSVQLEAVAALCELVLPKTGTPGARDAKVELFVDRFLATASDDFRAAFLAGLARLDRRALAAHERLFARASSGQQASLLGAVAAADAEFFENVRSLTVYGYFTSPEGLAALGWKLDAGPYAGCTHPEHSKVRP